MSTNYVGTGESFPITLRAVSGMSSTNTITIRPETGATVNLSANVPSNPIFSINGGTNWTIDGRAGGAGTTKSLTIENVPAGNHELRVTCASWIYKDEINQSKDIEVTGKGETKTELVSVPPFSVGYWVYSGLGLLVVYYIWK